jgi:hypothetical protein
MSNYIEKFRGVYNKPLSFKAIDIDFIIITVDCGDHDKYLRFNYTISETDIYEITQEEYWQIQKNCQLIGGSIYDNQENNIKPQKDNINPHHYKTGGIETFDYIKAKLSKEEVIGFCRGNCLKYISRCSEKGGKEDLQKAKWYLEKLIKLYE